MKRVISVINEMEKAKAIIRKGVEFSKKEGSILEILYVHEEGMFDIPDLFVQKYMREDRLDKDEIKKSLHELVQESGYKKDVAIFVYIDDTVDRVKNILKDQKAIIITSYKKEITEYLIKDLDIDLYIVRSDVESYEKILISTNLRDNANICIENTKSLFENSKLYLVHDHRFFIYPSSIDMDPLGSLSAAPIAQIEIDNEIKEEEREEFDKLLKEYDLEGDFLDDPDVEEVLREYIRKGDFDLVIFCTREDEFWGERSVVYSLLEELDNDILIYSKGE
jgi:hypothetical protein